MTKKESHIVYYLFLGAVLVGGLGITWSLAPNKDLQMISMVILSISYALIGIIHHLHNHDLVDKIVIEYVLVALLGIAASFFIFKGGFGI